jgi:hypothetical protein
MGAWQLGQTPVMVLKYSHTFNAMMVPIGAKIKNAIKELNNVKKIPPRGDTKNATIATNVRIVDVSSFNSGELLLFPSPPPGGKNMNNATECRVALCAVEDRIMLLVGFSGSCHLLDCRRSKFHRVVNTIRFGVFFVVVVVLLVQKDATDVNA